MPFTLFHPALVLPGRYLPAKWKQYFSITGLITGSVTPDFEKFIQMRAGNTYSHTLAGAFGLDLPMSVVLALLFHVVVKDTLIAYLPTAALVARFSVYKNQRWQLKRQYVVVLMSMLIGIFSHLALDSATHANGQLANQLPALSNYYEVLFLTIRGYQLLEVSYYVLSTLAIWLAFASLPQQYPKFLPSRNKAPFWMGVVGSTALISSLRLLINPQIRHIWDLASLATAAGLISLLLSCLVWRCKI
jgi:small basic protein